MSLAQLSPDWGEWLNPPRAWIVQHAAVPGLQWTFDKLGQVDSVKFHRSHKPLIPPTLPIPTSLPQQVPGLYLLAESIREAHGLRPYQKQALPFLFSRKASILGFEMRLGKTVTSLSVHEPNKGPLIIVGPLIARDVWRDWCERVFGWAPIALSSKSATESNALRGYPAYFVHYDILEAHVGFLPDPETLIIDEIHLLQARRSHRMSSISLLAQRAGRIIGLSGTPMWSNPASMWPILNLLSPGAWGSEFEFKQRYMQGQQTAYGWKFSGINNESELKSRLSELVLRLTWKEVLGSLPPITNTIEYVGLANSDLAKLDSLAQRATLEAASVGKHSPEAAIMSKLRLNVGKLKVKRAAELARDAMASGHKVVLWHWHNEVGQALQEALDPNDTIFNWDAKTYRITAEESQAVREYRINHFQEYDKPICFIAPLAVAGVGISLDSADLNIFVEQDWIPATNYQASMRIFKPNRPSANVWLFADCPVERRLMEVLGANEACQTAAGLGYEEIASKVLA